MTSITDKITEHTGAITKINCEQVTLESSFLDAADRFAAEPGAAVLMSGGDLDCARWHILGARPWLALKGDKFRLTAVMGDNAVVQDVSPLDGLQDVLKAFPAVSPAPGLPATAGFLGYFSYDLKDCIEDLPRTSADDLGLPQLCLYAPSVLLVHDKVENRTWLCIPETARTGKAGAEAVRAAFFETLAAPPPDRRGFHGNPAGFTSNFTRDEYEAAIRRIRNYIAAGDVYQVNMSQRFETDFTGDPFTLFKTLYRMNPAPFFAYIHAGDHHIVSTSPERFIRQDGARVETRPIKGTRPRGKTEEEDARMREALQASRKDDAELSMIVDLLRNDIGKVCAAGSVRVTQHKKLEAYRNVYHLVSIVEGRLDRGCDAVDLIRAVFPGGSITGCPKIRSMEIIDELETRRRHIYTGAIGYISFHDSMDLSIAIRTAAVCNEKIIFSVGGGVVYDSDPADEYEETLHKGRTLMEAFRGNGVRPAPPVRVWLNGKLIPRDDARVPVESLGFQYGYGFFETIRVDRGRPGFLDDHVDRFDRAWKALFFTDPPDVTWADVIRQVIDANGLADQVAAVKLLAAQGTRETPPHDRVLLVAARQYTHRLAERNRPGLRLGVHAPPRQTPLADHKTMNYLYYYLAGKWATANGFDEALILNPDGTASETNTGNLLLVKDNAVLIPKSPHVLPGVMAKAVRGVLAETGRRPETRPLGLEDLLSGGELIITNSLMGAVPALSVGETPLAAPSDLCETLNRRVL